MFNLFNKNKSKEYFLELDESKTSQPEVAQTPESAEPAVEKPVEAVKTLEAVPETKPASAAAEPTHQQKTKKTSKQTTAPATSPAAKWEPPFWVKAMQEATQKKVEEKAHAEMTFAGDNLLPLSQPRRRPGPSLNTFRNLARQAKIPIV